MVELTLEQAVVHGLALIAALLYVVVARMIGQRAVASRDRGPLRGFAMWWYGLAALGVLGIVFAVGFQPAAYGMAAVRAVVYAFIGLIYVMLGGLVYYLLYLYTGSKRSFWWVLGYYVVQMVFVAWLFESQGPYVGAGGSGTAELLYAAERAPGDPVSLAFSLGLIVPPLAAAAAYFAIFFRVQDATVRYRVLLVSTGLILWFTYSLLGTLTRSLLGVHERGFAGQLAGQLLGILAAVLVIMAHRPPRWAQQRFQVASLKHDRQREVSM